MQLFIIFINYCKTFMVNHLIHLITITFNGFLNLHLYAYINEIFLGHGDSGHSCFENILHKPLMCNFNFNLSFINFFHVSVLGHNSQMKILAPEHVSLWFGANVTMN